jgi:AraC-like DNA-binding protein
MPPLRLINPVVVMARVAERYGISPSTLLEGSGIVPSDLEDPNKRITLFQGRTITRQFIDLVNVPWIGLEVGKEYHFGANGKLGMAMMCCETVFDALKLLMNYIPLTGSYHHYELVIEGTTGRSRFHELVDLEGFREFCCEADVASIHAMARLSRVRPTDVFRELHFAYPRPSYADKYDELFRCPVIFNAPEHVIVFNASHLDTPLPLANSLALKDLEKDCRQILPLLQEQATLTARIHQELSSHGVGFPSLDQLADRINLSPRTLRRRLVEERTSYKGILSEIRKAKALELLSNTRMTMENVSLKLGFTDVSGFYKAFKSWTGKTPNRYREESCAVN